MSLTVGETEKVESASGEAARTDKDACDLLCGPRQMSPLLWASLFLLHEPALLNA